MSALIEARPFSPAKPARDSVIHNAAEEALTSSSHLRNRPIACEFHGGTIVLRGRVGRYYHKQIAQHVVMQIDGVEQVINYVEVEESLHRRR